MACAQTGFAMLCVGHAVQEAHDLAAIAHAATLTARVPFLHFFDGFRTSHEVAKRRRWRRRPARAARPRRDRRPPRRALAPDHPVLRGTAQNPDVFFQAREAGEPYYDARCRRHVEAAMARLRRADRPPLPASSTTWATPRPSG
jgi:pyruvate-ferredoxin/flavodoxin oxidoreductase